jgi:hypothetical protein
MELKINIVPKTNQFLVQELKLILKMNSLSDVVSSNSVHRSSHLGSSSEMDGGRSLQLRVDERLPSTPICPHRPPLCPLLCKEFLLIDVVLGEVHGLGFHGGAHG